MKIHSITVTKDTVWMFTAGILFLVLPVVVLGYDVIAAVLAGMIAGKWMTFSALSFTADNPEQTISVYDWVSGNS